MYFHHQYAEKDIPMGQEYEAIAYSKNRKIQHTSIQKCPSKVLCFFTTYKTQPVDHAMRGHHELGLIQFGKTKVYLFGLRGRIKEACPKAGSGCGCRGTFGRSWHS